MDHHGVVIESLAGELDLPRAKATVNGAGIAGVTETDGTVTEEVAGVDLLAVDGLAGGGVINDDLETLEGLDGTARSLAVGDEVDEVQLAKHGLDLAVHHDAGEKVGRIAKLLLSVDEGSTVEHVVEGGASAAASDVEIELVAQHGGRTEDTAEGVQQLGLHAASLVGGDQFADGHCRVVAGEVTGKVVVLPRLGAEHAGCDVLGGADLVGGEAGVVFDHLVVAVEILPEGHVDRAATFIGEIVELGVGFDDAGLDETGFLCRAFDNVGHKNLRDDNVTNLRFRHDFGCSLILV